MFKKLKDKIAEEVKSSPQRIQQIAQAVVSSTSSSTSDVSGNDNLFGIAEEDTPQNSPRRNSNASQTSTTTTPSGRVNTLSSSTHVTSTPVGYNGGVSRQRRLSNSSIGSDVSFRLPNYDAPAVYHLQSDLDVSASEVEDYSVNSGQLDLVSKEQLHQAYRKSLDRYQKYRSRYTELARRYRELERDNNKARSVLVETQDKALRRISELREQCTLEQQAKAHLESALRMEIEEKLCVIQSLKTKLSEENAADLQNIQQQVPATETLVDLTSSVSHEIESTSATDQTQLIDLSESFDSERINTLNGENKALNLKIQKLEELLTKYKDKLNTIREQNIQITNENKLTCEDLNNKIAEYEVQISDTNNRLKQHENKLKELSELKTNYDAKSIEMDHYKNESKDLLQKLNTAKQELGKLKKTEEENAILLAENKLEIHKELENKENEVKKLRSNVASLENERNVLNKEISELENKLKDYNNLKSENGDLCVIIKTFESENEGLKAKCEKLESSVSEFEKLKLTEDNINIVKDELQKSIDDRMLIEKQLKELVVKLEASENEVNTLLKDKDVEVKNKELVNQQNDELRQEIISLKSNKQETENQLKLLQTELHNARENVKSLENDLNNAKQLIEKAESEVLNKLKKDLKEAKELSLHFEQKYNELEQERRITKKEYDDLENTNQSLEEKIKNVEKQVENSKALFENSEILKQQLEKTNEELVAFKNQNNSLEKENKKLQNEQKLLLEKIENNENETKKEKELVGKNLGALQKILNDKDDELKLLKQTVSEKSTSEENSTKVLQEHISEINHLKQEHNHLNQKLQSYENSLRDFDKLKTEYGILQNNVSEISTKLNESLDKIQKVNEENKDLKNSNAVLSDKLTKVSEEHKVYLGKNNNLEQERKVFSEKEKQYKDKLGELETQMTHYRSKMSTWEQADIEKEYLSTMIYQLETELNRLTVQKSDVENNLQETKMYFEDNLNSKNQVIDNLSLENQKLKENFDGRLKELLTTIDNHVKLSESLHNKIEKLEEEKAELNSNLNDIVALKTERDILLDKVSNLNEVVEKFSKLQIDYSNSQTEIVSIKEEKKILDEKLIIMEECVTDMKKLKAANEELKKVLESSYNEKEDVQLLKQQLLDLEHVSQANESLTNERLEMVGRLQEMDIKREALEEDKRYINDKLSKMEEIVFTKSEEINHLSLKIDQMQMCMTEKTSLEEKYQALESVNKEKNVELHEKLMEENKLLKETLADYEIQISDIDGLRDSYKKIETENNLLQERLSDIESKYENCEKSIDSKISNLNQEIDDYVDRIKYLEKKCKDYDGLKQSNIELNKETNALNKKISELELTGNNGGDNVLADKIQLENKLTEIINEVAEVSNKNILLEQQCNNVRSLEHANEKLKLANEKLARQLDETLVTNQHADSITQSTEFEYLRNILYQYLSGGINSTGGNTSSTLVRVIAAVMKFDNAQTQAVLDKEAQRNTLLGQLHLI